MRTTLRNIVDHVPSSVSDEVVEIDLDELQQARQDPAAQGLLADAQTYGAALEREGRNR